MKKLYYDHANTLDPKHKFLASLQKKGFTLAPHTVEHPGKAFCRFILLKSADLKSVAYLEFVDIRRRNYKRQTETGLSFGYESDLEKFYHKIRKKVYSGFFHKNYEWKKDSESRLPGWNFLHFKQTGIRTYYPWITEYEPYKLRKKKKAPKHANGVDTILEVNLDVAMRAQKFYKHLAGKDQGSVKLSRGELLNLKASRTNRFQSIVLGCKSLDKFIDMAQPDRLITYKKKPAAVLVNPDREGWDLIVVER